MLRAAFSLEAMPPSAAQAAHRGLQLYVITGEWQQKQQHNLSIRASRRFPRKCRQGTTGWIDLTMTRRPDQARPAMLLLLWLFPILVGCKVDGREEELEGGGWQEQPERDLDALTPETRPTKQNVPDFRG